MAPNSRSLSRTPTRVLLPSGSSARRPRLVCSTYLGAQQLERHVLIPLAELRTGTVASCYRSWTGGGGTRDHRQATAGQFHVDIGARTTTVVVSIALVRGWPIFTFIVYSDLLLPLRTARRQLAWAELPTGAWPVDHETG
jgi:hypothetical protein